MLEKQDRDTANSEAVKFMVKRDEEPPPAEILYEGAVNKVMDPLHMVLAFEYRDQVVLRLHRALALLARQAD